MLGPGFFGLKQPDDHREKLDARVIADDDHPQCWRRLFEKGVLVTMKSIELPFLSIDQLTRMYKQCEASPVDAVNACLQRIRSHNSKINAFTLIDDQGALRAAAESEARWRRMEPKSALDGVPFTVKDNLMVSGYPFRRGSVVTPDQSSTEDAPIVARCREAGAIFLGLTTMPEFGVGPVTISPLTGITRNPWDIQRQSGGSSGGAAASVAAGFCNFAIGSDAGGSIRIPAALTGVVGLKPSAGRVPMYPASSAGTLSCNGPLTRTVGDAAIVLSYAARPDLRDGMASLADGYDYRDVTGCNIAGIRVAVSETLGYAQLIDPAISAGFKRAVNVFEGLGAVVAAEDPGIEDPIATYLTLLRAGYQYSLRNICKADKERLSTQVREVAFEDNKITLVEYLQALEECQLLARRFHEFHNRYDVLLTPTVAAPAFPAERHYPEEYEKFSNRRAWVPFTAIFNLTGQPAISVPIALTSQGLPIGLQIVGARGAEATILKAAATFEKANDFNLQAPL
jgi:aspartyl-tRNA(Asn)/glutamyl-tRNA(Gln) amidotransferase subunit A